MNSSFLESNNITSLINTVRTNVNQEINFDITSEQKYINVLKKLVKTIHRANIDKNVSTQYMNDLVVNKCVPFLVNQIKKNQTQNTSNRNNIFSNLPLQTNNRPEATRLTDTAIAKNANNNLFDQNMSDGNDFSSLTLAGELPLSNPYANSNHNPNVELPPRQMPNLTNMPDFNREKLEPQERQMPNLPSQNQSQHQGFEPPERQMPNLPSQNQSQHQGFEPPERQMPNLPSQNNLSMDIANLPAPEPVSTNTSGSNGNFDLAKDNAAGVNSTNFEENIDFAKRLEEMQKDRDYDSSSMNQFDNSNAQINTQDRNELKQRQSEQLENNNNFFKQLSDKNIETNPDSEREKTLSQMNNFDSKLQKNYMDDGDFDLDESTYSSYESNKIQLGSQNAAQSRENVSKFETNLRDKSRNVGGSDNPGISDMLKQHETQVSKDTIKEHVDGTFLSTNFQFDRLKRKVVCLDISDNLTRFTVDNNSTKAAVDNISNTYWSRFRVNLAETLIIDKLSDVFIESIIVNNPAQANPYSNLYMVMDIEEFNVKTSSNNIKMTNKFVLPNENTDSAGSTKIMKYHLKSNYIATINPTKLKALNFNITNEDGDSVQSDFTTFGRNITNTSIVGSSAASNMAISDATANVFRILDAVYNSSQQFIGNINVTNTDGNIQFMRSTKVHLYEGETLFYPNCRTSLHITTSVRVGSKELLVNEDPQTIFNTGDKVYLGTGITLGKISSMDANSITFEQGITQFVPGDTDSGAALYNANPLPRVFASNEKSNRIILELVIMSR
jgi:hypothetical protein